MAAVTPPPISLAGRPRRTARPRRPCRRSRSARCRRRRARARRSRARARARSGRPAFRTTSYSSSVIQISSGQPPSRPHSQWKRNVSTPWTAPLPAASRSSVLIRSFTSRTRASFRACRSSRSSIRRWSQARGRLASSTSALRAGLRQPALVGEDHRLDPVAQAELHQDALDVRLDRRLLDDELGRDLARSTGRARPARAPRARAASARSSARPADGSGVGLPGHALDHPSA